MKEGQKVFLVDLNGVYGIYEPCEVLIKQIFADGQLMVEKEGSETAQIVNPSQLSNKMPYALLDAE